MKMGTKHKKGGLLSLRTIGVFVAVVALLLLTVGQIGAQPTFPQLFWGELHDSYGVPAPAGTLVEAKVGGVVRGSRTTTVVGEYASYTFGPLLVQGAANGSTIVFYANGAACSPTASFQSGGKTNLDLTVAGSLPPPVTRYTLTMAVTGSGSTTPAVGTHDYDEGTVVDITATPASGWQFDSWTGGVANAGSATTTVTMDSDKTVTASFTESGQVVTHTLTMAVNGGGSTNPAVGTYDYAEGTVVGITATSASGWLFAGWSAGVANPVLAATTVTMDSNKTVTAYFSEAGGQGGGGGGGGGTVVTPTPTPTPTPAVTPTPGVTPTPVVTPTPSPATFEVVSLNVDPAEVEPGEIVVITARVANTGGVAGSYTLSLMIDGSEEAAQEIVDLAPGENELVSFTVTRDTAGTYTVEADGLSESFAVVEDTPLPAAFSLSNLSFSPEGVDVDEIVTISFEVSNTGETEGTYTATLNVEGVDGATKDVVLAAGETQTVTFSVSRDEPGDYDVQIGELSGTFTVEGTAVSWALVGGIIGGVLAIALAVFLLMALRRKRTA